ncbi:ArnT family glycosyltransferase [Methanocella sp. MCL-LM]|uniref:ArnT family glycosyltransferase n=1 Tax=Methanocella sp. MCL-LM TaxID=3412035 RepID=UPI003C782F36
MRAEARVSREQPDRLLNISDRQYFACCLLLFTLIIGAIVGASSLFMTSAWTTYDTARFYAMADVIVRGATPYLDFQDPKPPMIFFTLSLPTLLGQKYLGGLILVGLCNLVSAILVTKMAWDLYGRFSGFLAGLIFTVNIAFAQGYFILTEPFTITFILLATWLAGFTEKKHYLWAGICAGLAIGFKQYALLSVPLLAFLLWRNGDLKKTPALLAGVLVPLILMFAAIFLHYGVEAGVASLDWSFGVAATYLTEENMGTVTSYRTTDPLMLCANLAMAASVFTSLLIFALAGVAKDRRLDALEQYFLLSAVGFALTLVIRQYLHYWVLALPFFAFLCARQFRNGR